MNLSPTPNTVLAYASPARMVISLLGFSGFTQFAKYAGCHHHTVNECLYKPAKFRKRPSSFARVHDALVTRYKEFHDKLKPFERKFIKAWINDWIGTIRKNVDDKVFVTRYDRLEDAEIPLAEARRRRKRDEKRRKRAVAPLEPLA